MPADRAQPHAQQHGLHHRGGDRLPERERDDPARERDAPGDPRRARLEHLHGRQVAPLPRRRDEPRLDAAQLAERPRLRALVRVPRRRDEPVVSRPRLRQPPRRPAEVAGGGLPPDRRPHRQGDRVHHGREGGRAGEAVLPLLRARRLPRAAPRAEGVDRQVQGPLRHGLRGDARADARPAEGARDRPEGHRAAADQPDRDARDAHRARRQAVPDDRRDAAVGLALGRREAAVLPDGRGLRRVPRARRRPDRAPARLPRGVRLAREHARDPRLRQRRLRRGRPERLGQRDEVHERHPRQRSRPTCRCSTSSAARRRTTTTRTAGRWRSTRRSRCGSATSSTAARATRASSRGRPA